MDIYYRIGRLNGSKRKPISVENTQLVGVVSSTDHSINNTKKYSADMDYTQKLNYSQNSSSVSLVRTPRVRRLESLVKPSIASINRNSVEKPVSYEIIQELSEEKQEADKKEKIKVNKKIRQVKENLRKSKESVNNFRKYYNDLLGNQIGMGFACNSDPKDETCVKIGDSSYIRDLGICFVSPASNLDKAYLRTSVYLTDNGKQALKSYVKKQFKKRFQRKKAGEVSTEKKSKVSNSKIRKMIKNRDSFNFKINNNQVHVNLNGKVEIFSYNPNVETRLVDDSNLLEKESNRLRFYADKTKLKKWIYNTNFETNVFIADTVKTLSGILEQILN